MPIDPIDHDLLDEVAGGRSVIEGLRNLYNAGVVALSVANPQVKPPPRIPDPPRIEKVVPLLTPAGAGSKPNE